MTEEMYTKITDHEEEIKARQVWQYENQENWDKLLEMYAERTQEYEDILWQLLTERALSNAVGVTLDRIGEYYQVERNGLPDNLYRNLITTTLSRLQSAGQVEVLLDALRLLSLTQDVALSQVYPATVLMTVFVAAFGDTPNPTDLNNTMQLVKAAGVKLVIVEETTSNSPFVPTYGTLLPGDAGKGFATQLDGSDGGSFSSIIK
jgi:hypothetical protein